MVLNVMKIVNLMGERKRSFLITVFLSAVFVSLTSFVVNMIFKDAINSFVYSDYNLQKRALILCGICIILILISTPFTSYICNNIAKKSIYKIKIDLFSHIIRLPRLSYFDKKPKGEIQSLMTNDVGSVEAIYGGQLYFLLFNVISGTTGLIAVLYLNWRLAIVNVFFVILTYFVNFFYSKILNKKGQEIQEHRSNFTSFFSELFNSVRTIKLFNAYSTINKKFEHINSDLIQKKKKVAAYEGIIEGLNNFLSSATFVSIIGIGAFMVQEGMTNWGTVIAILAFKAMIDDLIKVGNSISSLQTSVAGVERVYSAYTEDIEVESKSIINELIELGQKKPVVTFSNVSFCYSDKKKVLDNINFIAYSNTKVAILGPSGEGKSTIAKLIVDLYKPTTGTILLQSDVAYVPQDAFIFDESIYNNILYGKPNATKDEVLQAARKANVLDFVNEFPKGFETRVGENGSMLSGGQKQRITIARAFLKNAGIIVMDEPTSALDSVSEKKVLHAIENLMEGRCTIFITHRLESIKDFDYVYRIEDGQIKVI